jgi:hypothetical protein
MIAVRSGNFAFLKRRPSAFDGTWVAELLHILRRDAIIGGANSPTTKTFPNPLISCESDIPARTLSSG